MDSLNGNGKPEPKAAPQTPAAKPQPPASPKKAGNSAQQLKNEKLAEEKRQKQEYEALVKKELDDAVKIKELVNGLNQQHFRAPVGVVQCSKEREACLACYRDNENDALTCRETAEAFQQCASKKSE